MDPLAEKYYSISPYAYCAGNPVKYIDPTGMMIDDYFNENGDYLGKDKAKTDNIKITSQQSWDVTKKVNSDGTESIDHATGAATSIDNSTANLSTDAELSVYDHYNPTGLPLVDAPSALFTNGQTGMSFQSDKKSAVDIAVDVKGLKAIKVSDHANEIINFFVHEGTHYDDFKSQGVSVYNNTPENTREQNAIKIQMKDPTFLKMRNDIQKAWKKYGVSKGMTF